MSTNIGNNDVSNFLIHRYHTTNLSYDQVEKLGINIDKYLDTDKDGNQVIEWGELNSSESFYAAFVSLVEKEQDSQKASKDEDSEKSEKNKVKDKSGV